MAVRAGGGDGRMGVVPVAPDDSGLMMAAGAIHGWSRRVQKLGGGSDQDCGALGFMAKRTVFSELRVRVGSADGLGCRCVGAEAAAEKQWGENEAAVKNPRNLP